MDNARLYDGEMRLMQIIWDHEPVPSGRLVELCLEHLGWKKSTTYTMVKRLGDKGYVKNENAVVTALVSRGEVLARESRHVVEQTFSGSLPGFLVAFLNGKTISSEEAEAIRRLIEEHREA